MCRTSRPSATRHVLSYGGNIRHNAFDLSIAPLGSSRNEQGVYVQDEMFLSEKFRWQVGVRMDHFDVLEDVVFSPRTTLMFKPAGATRRSAPRTTRRTGRRR